MYYYKILFIGLFIIFFLNSTAQETRDSLHIVSLEEVVVTDTKFKHKRKHSGKIITSITSKELQHAQGKTVAEVLNNISGITINGSRSSAGQNLNYYVRGGRNRQVLIVIDGIPLSDPSQIANDYDLRLLDVSQVESIEVLKGASSTLYGSGAATAVISITLKKANLSPFALNLKTVVGSNQSQKDSDFTAEDFSNRVSVSGSLKKFNYLASFGHQYTNGLSAIANGQSPDEYNRVNSNIKLGYQFSPKFKTTMYGSSTRLEADFDDSFAFQDADNTLITDQNKLGFFQDYTYKKGSVVLTAAFNHIKRKVESNFPTRFKASSLIADMYHTHHFNSKIHTVFGINLQNNSMESSSGIANSFNNYDINSDQAKYSILDPYANLVYVSKIGFSINSGIRINHHNEYGSHLVYSVNPSFTKDFDFGYLKALLSYSTAYITPSLYQLFEPSFGNTNLDPEVNKTLEIGAELKLDNRAIFSILYFNRKETNFIDFIDIGNYEYKYSNINQPFIAQGIEIETDISVTKNIQFKSNGTYTKVEDHLNLRIPKYKINASLQYNLWKTSLFQLTYQYNSNRNDNFFNPSTFENETIRLRDYSLIDIYASQSVLKNTLRVFVNFSNVLNENYQEVFGFSTKGRNLHLGLVLNL